MTSRTRTHIYRRHGLPMSCALGPMAFLVILGLGAWSLVQPGGLGEFILALVKAAIR